MNSTYCTFSMLTNVSKIFTTICQYKIKAVFPEGGNTDSKNCNWEENQEGLYEYNVNVYSLCIYRKNIRQYRLVDNFFYIKMLKRTGIDYTERKLFYKLYQN